KRVMLKVAYDGTNYHGWQIQPNVVTIESVLNETLSGLLKEEIKVIGASRTDTGVHALGNIAVFDTNARIPADKISYALNQRLPEDIRIQLSKEVAPDFHPRHQNSKKTYEYKILNCAFPVPVYRLYSYFTYVKIDVEKMRQAASYLVGEHDFKSFCSTKTVAETTVRTIYGIRVEKSGDLICVRVTGSGFLYNMVRIIVGTLMEAGKGNIAPERMTDILNACSREHAGPTLPACGLTLIGYEYL
ncbi:MAG: tRNA pseudouridine(38-40) synthase TruA, partial [Lachnospiraceae bacterium]|nr:tRNA pseudouridine(38-40) synthase TruA [Lachnospiraceae bacterium]